MASSREKLRIAVVDPARCKPKKCGRECKKQCPVVRMGKSCVEVESSSKIAWISEVLCNGCGICVKKCPMSAIKIVNLPKALEWEAIHRHGPNGFVLHRLPVPRLNQVLGLVGANGTGKSTCLKILSGKVCPNLGDGAADSSSWEDALNRFKGSELQNYLERARCGDLKAVVKPQYVDALPKQARGTVRQLLRDERGSLAGLVRDLDLETVLDRDLSVLSGGELQRFAVAACCARDCRVYLFDEPSSYLDVKQRIRVARCIRDARREDGYVVVVEHDLSILDYVSDFVCLLYGTPSAYGVVTAPYGRREGINVFLDGYLPAENVRFRDFALRFDASEREDVAAARTAGWSYPDAQVVLGNGDFRLQVEAGQFSNSEIVVLMGENGTGKTTFVQLLAGQLNQGEAAPFSVSHKPQKIAPKGDMTVVQLLQNKIRGALSDSQFVSDVLKLLKLEDLYDRSLQELSGGELQRLAIAVCLGTPADVYLIDEPSAYLDSEQRLLVAKLLKRFVYRRKVAAFVVEHDFVMATYLADRVVVFSGVPSSSARASAPRSLLSGVNEFLRSLDVTFRRDPKSFRPRINKPNGRRDQEQKAAGTWFAVE